MVKEELKKLTCKVTDHILAGEEKKAFVLLKPCLDSRIPFRQLDLLGKEIGRSSSEQFKQYLEFYKRIIDYNAMGGFVIVSQALIHLLARNHTIVMRKSREYIIKGDKWYVCDIIGERSLGQALVDYFEKTLPWLDRFLRDENGWVKRSVGVAIHFFSKRVLNEPTKTKKLLSLIEPYMEEKQTDAVKGIGWALKTIGKYHPDILVQFMKRQFMAGKNISRLMKKKATTYLPKMKN